MYSAQVTMKQRGIVFLAPKVQRHVWHALGPKWKIASAVPLVGRLDPKDALNLTVGQGKR